MESTMGWNGKFDAAVEAAVKGGSIPENGEIHRSLIFVNDTLEMAKLSAEQVFGEDKFTNADVLAIFKEMAEEHAWLRANQKRKSESEE